MKSKTYILVPAVILLLAGLAADDVGAGLFDRDKDGDEREMKTFRYDRLPTMEFVRGRIMKDTPTSWKVDNTKVVFGKECEVMGPGGDPTRVNDGAEVVLMGARIGDTIVAWHVRTLKPGYMLGGGEPRSTITWSESDPDVGEDTHPE